jgi:hypothetical protein
LFLSEQNPPEDFMLPLPELLDLIAAFLPRRRPALVVKKGPTPVCVRDVGSKWLGRKGVLGLFHSHETTIS